MKKVKLSAFHILCVCVLCGLSSCGGKESVKLLYRFSRGDTHRYRLTITGEGKSGVSGLPGQESGMGEKPWATGTECVYSTTVTRVGADETADISLLMETLTARTESGDLSIVIEADENGVRMRQGEHVIHDAPGMEGITALFTRPMEMKMDTRGRISTALPAGGTHSFLPYIDIPKLITQLQFSLPKEPVTAGDSWLYTRDMMQAPGLDQVIKGKPDLAMEVSATLEGFEKGEGRRLARIRLDGELDAKDVALSLPRTIADKSAAEASFDALSQNLQGILLFDHEEGVMHSMECTMTQHASMRMKMSRKGSDFALSTTTAITLKIGIALLN